MILVSNRCLTGTYLLLNFDTFEIILKKEIYNFKVENTSNIYYLTEIDFFLIFMSVIYYKKCHIQLRLFHKMLLILIILSIRTGTYVHI